MESITESDVGMSEYLGMHKGFSGILKMRYQDFLVNEIDEENRVLYFTSMLNDELVDNKIPKKETSHDLSLLSMNEHELLKQLQDGTATQSFVLLAAGNDKVKRTQLHQLIRQSYSFLESETIEENNEKKIKVTKCDDRGLNKRRRDSKPKKQLIQFLLYKENISTMDAINVLLKKLHFKHSKCFQYAGNKDKRGVTVQAMTTMIPVERLQIINSATRNIRVGNFKTCQRSLHLGDLSGNRFSIAIRNIGEVDTNEAVSSLCKMGFINYFGMQRFGTKQVPTYTIGKALLASKWSDAVDLILSSVTDEDESLLILIKNWKEDGCAAEAYKKLSNKSSFEGFLLQGIAQYGSKQLVQALCRIPRPTRLLYLHSYQSYIWNHAISHRLRQFGHLPVVGDMVLTDEPSNDDDANEPNCKRRKVDDQPMLESNRRLSDVKVLTEADVSKYQLSDIVLPLPGSQIVYPPNMKEYYQRLLQEDLLDTQMFNHRVKDYALSGAYRKVVVRPRNVDWNIAVYDDLTTPLFVTDLEKISGKGRIEQDEASCGRFRALRIHFDLPSSSYATVALRELTKSDMSVSAQSKLGERHRAQVADNVTRTLNEKVKDEETLRSSLIQSF